MMRAYVSYRTAWRALMSKNFTMGNLHRQFLPPALSRMIARVLGWLILALIVLAIGTLLIVLLAGVIALSLLRPPRMSDGKAMYILRRLSPGDLGMPFEPIRFSVADAQTSGDKIDLASWWIPSAAPSAHCVVLLHGYADAKVGAIAWAPLWRALGFNILAIDLRAHGESGGRHSTGGYFERDELIDALQQLRSLQPRATQRIVLFGVSLGAAVALATAQRRPDLIDAVVVDCPFADFRSAAASHIARMGAPDQFVIPLAMRFAEMFSGAKLDQMHPTAILREIACPVLVIQSAADAFVGEANNAALATAATGRGNISIWRVAGAEHLLALAVDPSEYERRVRDFISDFIRAIPND